MSNGNESFGHRLAELLEARGLNQSQAARALACSTGFLSDVINDVKRPGLDFLEKVQKELQASLDWLVGGQGLPQQQMPVDLQDHRLLLGAVEVVRAALLESDPDALAIVEDLLSPSAQDALLSTERVRALQHWGGRAETALLALGLHNTHLNEPSLARRIQGALTASLALFQARKVFAGAPSDEPSTPGGRRRSREAPERERYPRLTMNIGKSVRSATGNYIENHYHDHRGGKGDD